MNPTEQDDVWRKLSDDIFNELLTIKAPDRLNHFKARLASLPNSSRVMVEHFVAAALIINDGEERVMLSRHSHISLITFFSFLLGVLLILGGIYLVFIRGDDAKSHINVLGATIETDSIGVACFALAVLLFIFVARKALSRI